eukprot:1862898-Amphidinium_carterae.1
MMVTSRAHICVARCCIFGGEGGSSGKTSSAGKDLCYTVGRLKFVLGTRYSLSLCLRPGSADPCFGADDALAGAHVFKQSAPLTSCLKLPCRGTTHTRFEGGSVEQAQLRWGAGTRDAMLR